MLQYPDRFAQPAPRPRQHAYRTFWLAYAADPRPARLSGPIGMWHATTMRHCQRTLSRCGSGCGCASTSALISSMPIQIGAHRCALQRGSNCNTGRCLASMRPSGVVTNAFLRMWATTCNPACAIAPCACEQPWVTNRTHPRRGLPDTDALDPDMRVQKT